MPRPSPAPYRYQDIYCYKCRGIKLHRQTRPFSRKVRMWSDCSYKCQCCAGKRRAKPFRDLELGNKYAKTKVRMGRGAGIKNRFEEAML